MYIVYRVGNEVTDYVICQQVTVCAFVGSTYHRGNGQSHGRRRETKHSKREGRMGTTHGERTGEESQRGS